MKLHIVPARTGVDWVRQGIRVFWRQPLALTLLFFTTTAAMSLLSVLPLIGPAIALALLPTATLVMMEAAAETSLGRIPTPALILHAFRTGRQRLGADARGVTERGLYYTLEDGVLTSGFPLGVSNHFTGSAVRVAVRRGCLLIGICDKE